MNNLSSLRDFGVSWGTSFVRCELNRNLSKSYNVTSFAAQLNFTSERLKSILEEFVDFDCVNYALSVPKIVQHAVQGWTALIMFTLMLGTLWKLRRTLSPCTLIYHAATAVFEYPIAVNGIAVGHLWYHAEEPYYNRIWTFVIWRHYLASGWTIADGFKLALSCLTFFLCIERFVAICIPIRFNKINRPVVALSAVGLSLLVGSAHFWYPLTVQTPLGSDGVYKVTFGVNPFGPAFGRFYELILQFCALTRIFFCGGIFFLCIATVIGLKKRANKIRDISSAAQEEEFKMRNITKLSLTIAICVMIDHVPWIVGRYWEHVYKTDGMGGSTTVLYQVLIGHTYEDVANRAYNDRVSLALYHWYVWSQWFLHGIRFLVYLAFNQTMRDAFVRLIMMRD